MGEYYSFVIPCYGSEQTITGVVKEIERKMSERPNIVYEIIAVNDCSPDNVLSVLKDILKNNTQLKIIDLAKNGGKHAAMMAGFSVVQGDIIINLDDDGQCPLDRLWDLVEPLYNGYDISIAKYSKKMQSIVKNFGSRINAIMATHLIAKPKTLELSNFSAVKRFAIDEMKKYTNPYPYIDGLFIRTTSKIRNVEMEERERTIGRGNYTIKKSLSLWLNGFTAFSVKPLRVATLFGCICAVVGFIYGFFTIINKLMHPEILVGYSSLMAVLLFVGGLIMIMLGLIGEYIGRIYISINNSPQYVIREMINIDKGQ